MFLIEYKYGQFINAEKIEWVSVGVAGKISFTLISDNETALEIDKPFQEAFVNCLQAINQNTPNSIQSKYTEVNQSALL